MLPLSMKQRDRGGRLLLLLFLLTLILFPQPAPTQPHPEDTLLFRDGEILFSKGDTERALWRFKKIVTDHPQSPLFNEAKFRMALCYTQLKRPREAIRFLNELFSSFLAPSRMVQVFSLLGENHLELGDRFSALHWYGKGLLVPGQPQGELKKRVQAIIDTFGTEEELKRVESLYRGAYAGGYAKWRLAQMAKRRGNDLLAKNLMQEWEKEYPETAYLPKAKEPTEVTPPPSKSTYTIGVILPLSGTHQPYGERVLQAIQLAIKDSDSQMKNPLISLVIQDSKGNPSDAEKAVEELVTKENAIAILGPLLSVDVDKAAQRAQQLKVPMITFSQKEIQPGKNEFIFQNSILPSSQIQTLVTFALKKLELKTFGIFYPNSPYGVYFRNMFSQEVSRQGGRILGAVAYQEDQTDFSYEIRSFFKIEAVKDQETPRRRSGDEFMSALTIDGLFIPDTHDRVGLILSQIAYYDVQGLTFLGTNGWNGPDLLSIAGKSAEGAYFTDAFFKKYPSLPSVRFVEAFRKAYQRDPETLEALGYEGAKLLAEILRSKPVSSPGQLNEEISNVQNFQGVCGLKGFGEGGKPIRTISILRVNNGQVELVIP
jgi:branched-chain amino acid transport system substrate-binding protein